MNSQVLAEQERVRFIQRGKERYELLRAELEKMHRGEYVGLSVETGNYVVTGDDVELKRFRDSLGPDDFFWLTRVGST